MAMKRKLSLVDLTLPKKLAPEIRSIIGEFNVWPGWRRGSPTARLIADALADNDLREEPWSWRASRELETPNSGANQKELEAEFEELVEFYREYHLRDVFLDEFEKHLAETVQYARQLVGFL